MNKNTWQPMLTAPRDGRDIYLCYQSQNGKPQRCLAYWVGFFEQVATENDTDDVDCLDYKPDEDTYYLKSGWYEPSYHGGVHTRIYQEYMGWAELPELPVKFDL